jgi:adenylate cyclase
VAKKTPDDEFREVLTGEHSGLTRMRGSLKRLPSSPRCKLCAAPFEGVGGAVLKHFGFARFPANPAICQACVKSFREKGLTGAEIPVTLLFADVRGSTGIAERMSPTEFRGFLDHFYRIGTDAILRHDGLVDKLVGDEVIGLFFGGVTGPGFASAAIDAAIELVERTGRPAASPSGPIPIGVGIHTGDAYVGTTGPPGAVDDFTALGDPVNTTARLAAAARPGEILLSVAAAQAAARWFHDAERRTLQVRGRQEPIEVLALHPAPSSTGDAS